MRKSKNSRRRAAVLIAVHVAIAAHIAHWAVTGRTISPIEPSESMYTIELGHVNAGFIFFAAAILLTFVFGRFFCGWGCHVVALQDLCAALMKKIGIRPQPFRSRLLAWVPLVVAFYMFAWPAVKRVALQPLFAAYWPSALPHIATPAFPGFTNHLLKEDFWETFATWPVAIPFLLICGFAAVYFLGAKGFCTYGCPYGAIFAGADRLTAGKIIADLSRCEGCGHCTATCTSNVRVHEEIQVYSKVVSAGCMKCLDCVSVCPNDALSYGFAAPALFTPRIGARTVTRRYDLGLWEEILLAILFACVFFAMRGAYGLIPMLMALGISGCTTFIAWKLLHLLRGRDPRLHRFQFRRDGKLTGAGRIFAAGALVLMLLVAHTGWMTFERFLAGILDDRVRVAKADVLVPNPRLPGEVTVAARAALEHFERASGFSRGGWGLFHDSSIDMEIAWLAIVLGDRERAIDILEEVVATGRLRAGALDEVCEYLGWLYFLAGRHDQGTRFLAEIAVEHPDSTRVRELLVVRYFLIGNFDAAAALYERHLRTHPKDSDVRARLASLIYLPAKRTAEAIAELERAIADEPMRASLHNDLATAYLAAERLDDAIRAMARAAELDPEDKSYREHLGELETLRAAGGGIPPR
ncbi:MAG: tetratricopeptide repeat protein [Planctomycetes bacterium]|nr:tetratricopeptide repeat protein [Planctomycetota bacterium]